jgi:predicted permease
MQRLTSLWRRLLALVRRRRLERDLDDEVAFHLAMREAELQGTGTSPDRATAEARRLFGSTALIREQTREAWTFHAVETALRDVRFALRTLRRSPGFAAATIVVLALGIGANAAIFSLIRTILLEPLPFSDPGQLAFVRTVPPNRPEASYDATVPDYLAWRSQTTSFAALAATWPYTRTFGVEENGAAAERITGQRCTPELLQELGITPLRGRLFTAAEDEIDRPAPIVLISERLWRRRFASDPDILGKSIRMDGRDITIIGVVAVAFRLFGDDDMEFFEPFLFYKQQLQGSPRYITVLGRLKPGVTMAAAQSDIDVIARRVAAQFPQVSAMNGKPWGVRVQPMHEVLVGSLARPLLLLQGAVAFVLLIACANIAGLLLARASARHREVGIRLALGASRGQLIRQLLTESLVLALVGGAVGVFLGWGGLRVLVALAPPAIPRLSEVALDPAVLAFSVAASLAAGLVFGLVPALHASAPERRGAAGELGRSVTSGAKAHRLRMVLVAGQLALALVSLTGAGLLTRSFLRLEHTPLNADPSGVLTFQVAVPRAQYGKATGEMYQGLPAWEFSSRPNEIFSDLLGRVRSIAGVQSAAAAVLLPFTGGNDVTFALEGAAAPAATNTNDALYAPVSDGYFRMMKIPLVEGREFTDRDVVSAPWVAVISETMARRIWPDADPIGKRLTLNLSADERPREIVGVARDTPSYIGEDHPQPVLYVPFSQRPAHVASSNAGTRIQMSFMLRTTGDPLSAIPAVRHAATQVDPEMPLSDIETLEKTLGRELQYPRAFSLLLGVFAAAAILLAAIGIYGVMAFGVAQRTREIGIRVALGASGAQLIRLVLRGAVVMLAVGVGLGLAGSLAVTRLLGSFLWQIKPTDAPTFAASAGLIVLVGVAASLVPAMRALTVDPTTALRSE